MTGKSSVFFHLSVFPDALPGKSIKSSGARQHLDISTLQKVFRFPLMASDVSVIDGSELLVNVVYTVCVRLNSFQQCRTKPVNPDE